MTKKELLAVRDDSYDEPEPRFNRCGNCRHFWGHPNTRGSCHRVEIRGELIQKDVSPLGVCALWEDDQK